jgi:hypothetical protein
MELNNECAPNAGMGLNEFESIGLSLFNHSAVVETSETRDHAFHTWLFTLNRFAFFASV